MEGRADLLLAMVFPEVQPVEDVGMPGLQVDRKRALPLAAALVNIPADGISPSLSKSWRLFACLGTAKRKHATYEAYARMRRCCQ